MRKSPSAAYVRTMALCAVLLLAVGVGATMMGQYFVSISDFAALVRDGAVGRLDPALDTAVYVVSKVRIPRVVLAGMVGAGLSVSGAALQGAFQNPLVSPDLLGVCAGAGFGAACGILLTGGIGFLTPAFSLLFGLASIVLVFFLAGRKDGAGTLSVVLGGIIVTSIFIALTSLIKYIANDSEVLPAITFFQMGSFANVGYGDILIAVAPVVSGIVGLLLLRGRINLLSLGDEDCFTLGVHPARTRWTAILFATLTTAGCVTVSGVIGWVGLVIPHICRRLVGVNHSYSLPASCLIGAVFMIVVDTVARSLTAGEIPIGILTALIGAPFFALIYRRNRRA